MGVVQQNSDIIGGNLNRKLQKNYLGVFCNFIEKIRKQTSDVRFDWSNQYTTIVVPNMKSF